MLKKEELMLLKNTELSAMCKERGIAVYRGKTHINKTEMIDRLLSHKEAETVEKPVEKVDSVEVKENTVKTENNKHSERTVNPVVSPAMKKELKDMISQNQEKEETTFTPWIMGNKDELIERAEVGTLFAFIDAKGKPRTAKMVNRSSSRRVVKLVTEFDWEFIVSYDSVLWVRFGARWPKAVYNMLKEYRNGKPVCIKRAETENN